MSEKAASSALQGVHAAARTASTDDADTTVKRLFMFLHGLYGNLFLSKFATGDLDAQGKDRGILSARMVWRAELARFNADTVMSAAQRCKEDHKDFPPNLGQFEAICRALQPRRMVNQTPPSNLVGMSAEARSAHSRRVREAAMAKLRARMDAETGHVAVEQDLCGLKQLVALAVATAGGDEVATLRRLDLELAPRRESRRA